MPRTPMIGITCGYREFPERQEMNLFLPERYVQGIENAGGLPVLLPITRNDPMMEALAQRIDGLLLTGGPDIPADYWGEETHETADPARRERIEFEFKLLRRILTMDKPVLGICLGHQVMNVALGGALTQDIATFLPEANDHRRPPGPVLRKHRVYLKPGSRLRDILQSEAVEIATSHHQVVRKPGKGCEITGWSEDNLIESTEIPDREFAVSVQWHPELLIDDEATVRLFTAFTRAAGTIRGTSDADG